MLICLLLISASLLDSTVARIPAERWRPLLAEERLEELDLSIRSLASFASAHEVVLIDDRRVQVHIFSIGAGKTRTLGRAGSGPGEFNRIVSFGWLRDTLWFAEGQSYRITYFPARNTRAVGTANYLRSGTVNSIMSSPLGLTSNGRVLTNLVWAGRSGLGMQVPQSMPFVSTDRSGRGVWDTLALVYQANLSFRLRVGGTTIEGRQPMTDADLWSINRNGTVFVTLKRDDRRLMNTGKVALHIRHFAVGKDRRVELDVGSSRTSQQEIQYMLRQKVASFDLSASSGKLPKIDERAFRAVMYVPQMQMPFTDMFVADDGRILLRGNDWRPGWIRYTILNPEGQVIRQFETDSTIRIRSIFGDRLLAFRERADGLVDLVVAELPRR